MEFKIYRVSGKNNFPPGVLNIKNDNEEWEYSIPKYGGLIKINTVNDLLGICQDTGCDILISNEDMPKILIVDDYLD